MQSDRHGVGSVIRFEFVEDISDVSFHGIFANIQTICDSFVGAAFGDQLPYFHLSLGQRLLGSVLPEFRSDFRLYRTQSGVDRSN